MKKKSNDSKDRKQKSSKPAIPLAIRQLRLLYWRRLPAWGRLMLASSILGISVGVLAAGMHVGLDWVNEHLFMSFLGADGVSKVPTHPWLIPLVPAAGGLIAGLLVYWLAPECFGGGSDHVIACYNDNGRPIRKRVIPVKWLTACLAIGSGGAGGGEGPMSQIGASAGSMLANFLGFGRHGRRMMLTAGVAAGVGAFFRAPLGGALFACEIYYSQPDLEADALLPSLLASVAAYSIFGVLQGFQPLLSLDSASTLLNLPAFAMLTVLALGCALSAHWLIGDVKRVEHKMESMPGWLRPALGGLLAGGGAWIAMSVYQGFGSDTLRPGLALGGLGEGYSLLRMAQSNTLPSLLALGGLLLLRLWTTSFSLGSSSPVGSFAPAMVLGGLLGLFTCSLAHLLHLPGISAGALTLCGMAGFFAAVFRCPLAAVVMILEVGEAHHMLPALMWVAAVAYLLAPAQSLVHGQLQQREEPDQGVRDF